jgi:hypothetical protein
MPEPWQGFTVEYPGFLYKHMGHNIHIAMCYDMYEFHIHVMTDSGSSIDAKHLNARVGVMNLTIDIYNVLQKLPQYWIPAEGRVF